MATNQHIENMLFTPRTPTTKEETLQERKTLSKNFVAICIAIPFFLIVSFGIFLIGIFIGPFWLIFAAAALTMLTILCFLYLHITRQRMNKSQTSLRQYFSGYLPKNVTGYTFIDTHSDTSNMSALNLPTYDEAVVGDQHYRINGILIVYTDKNLPSYEEVVVEPV